MSIGAQIVAFIAVAVIGSLLSGALLGLLIWLWSSALCPAVREERRRVKTARLDGLSRRADQQNQWFLQGDPRGIYGDEYRP